MKLPAEGVTGPPTRGKCLLLWVVIVCCGLLVGHGFVGGVAAWVLLGGVFVLARFVL